MSCRNKNCHCGNGKIPGYDDPCDPKNCIECGTYHKPGEVSDAEIRRIADELLANPEVMKALKYLADR